MVEERPGAHYFCWGKDIVKSKPDLWNISLVRNHGVGSWISALLVGEQIPAIRTQNEAIEVSTERRIAFKVEPGSYVVPIKLMADKFAQIGRPDIAEYFNTHPFRNTGGISFQENEIIVHDKITTTTK